MLDTIALTLDHRQFEIMDPDRFSPSASGLLKPPYYPLGARGNFSCFLNPTKADFDAGIYRPRLTLTKRKGVAGFPITLRVEFSAPKLIFGNNFDELRSQDFDCVLATLRKALADVSVRVTEDALRAAGVSAVHYSKNFALTDFTSCSMVMTELGKIDLPRRLDLSHTDYRNEGHAIRYHANSFELTFYDKIKDLEQARISEKRALERDNRIQADLFKTPGRFPKELQVLRMEVRLGNRTKIRQVLGRIDADIEPTFAAVFDIDISQRVLLHFWSGVRTALPLLGQTTNLRPEERFETLARDNPKTKPAMLLQLLGWQSLASSVGMRGMRALLVRRADSRTWHRLKRKLSSRLTNEAGFCALAQLDTALTGFQPLRMSTFQTGSTQGSVRHDRPKQRPAGTRRQKHSSSRMAKSLAVRDGG